MNDLNDRNEIIKSKKKYNFYCEGGFLLGIFSFFYSGFFIVPTMAAILSIVGLVTFKNSKHKNKWKAYWGLFLGTLLALTNFV